MDHDREWLEWMRDVFGVIEPAQQPLPGPHPILWHGLDMATGEDTSVTMHTCHCCGFFTISLDVMATHMVRSHNWPEDLGDLVPS